MKIKRRLKSPVTSVILWGDFLLGLLPSFNIYYIVRFKKIF